MQNCLGIKFATCKNNKNHKNVLGQKQSMDKQIQKLR